MKSFDLVIIGLAIVCTLSMQAFDVDTQMPTVYAVLGAGLIIANAIREQKKSQP